MAAVFRDREVDPSGEVDRHERHDVGDRVAVAGDELAPRQVAVITTGVLAVTGRVVMLKVTSWPMAGTLAGTDAAGELLAKETMVPLGALPLNSRVPATLVPPEKKLGTELPSSCWLDSINTWLRLARRKSNPFVALAVTMLAAAASSIHWLARPHLFTLLFLVLFYAALEQEARQPKPRVTGLVTNHDALDRGALCRCSPRQASERLDKRLTGCLNLLLGLDRGQAGDVGSSQPRGFRDFDRDDKGLSQI